MEKGGQNQKNLVTKWFLQCHFSYGSCILLVLKFFCNYLALSVCKDMRETGFYLAAVCDSPMKFLVRSKQHLLYNSPNPKVTSKLKVKRRLILKIYSSKLS